jgi:ABC-type transport system involved in multi-copper enzyme maturation permease subunit
MKQALSKLFWAEFRRQWTLTTLFIPLLFMVIGGLITFMPSRFDKVFDVVQKLSNLLGFLVPITSVLFCVGGVANDVKDGWLRTLLMRPLQRQQYLTVKMAVVFCLIWITVLFAGGLPFVAKTVFTPLPIEFDFLRTVTLLGAFVGVSVTYIAILSFLSCWAPGILNVVVLMVWGLVSSAAHYYVVTKLWDVKWAVLAEEFIFPGGMFDTVSAIAQRTHVPYAEVLWGLAAIAMFLALAFWSITRIQVDKTTE